MKKLIYLCGPITGLSEGEASVWRQYVAARLAPDLVAIDPTRDNVQYTRHSERQLTDQDQIQRLLHGKETLARDRMDVARADLLLVNLLADRHISIGAVGEIFWADAYRKPVIVVRESQGNPHDHDLINAIACCLLPDLDSAIAKANRMLSSISRSAQ